MSAPQTIHDVLAAPHIKRLIGDQGFAFVEAEPLRFIPASHLGASTCRTCGVRTSAACDLASCPRKAR